MRTWLVSWNRAIQIQIQNMDALGIKTKVPFMRNKSRTFPLTKSNSAFALTQTARDAECQGCWMPASLT